VRFSLKKNTVIISAEDIDLGREAKETIKADYAAEPMEIGFNADFLRDGIESVDGDEVMLRLISPLRPGLLRGGSGDFWYLIMPIRLAG